MEDFIGKNAVIQAFLDPQNVGAAWGDDLPPLEIGRRDPASEVGIDWLNCSCDQSELPRLLRWAVELSGDPIQREGRFQFHDQHLEFSFGFHLAFDTWDETAEGRVGLVFTGSFFKYLDGSQLLKFVGLINSLKRLSVTRLDVRFDDRDKLIKPSDVWHVAKAGNLSGFIGDKAVLCASVDAAFTWGKPYLGEVGETLNLGTRGKNGSGCYLRYYMKNVESQGEIDAYRWEQEYTGGRSFGKRKSVGKAHQAFERLAACSTVDDLAKCIGSLVTAPVTFLDKASTHLDRCELLPWWRAIVDRCGQGARITVKRVKTRIEEKMDWMMEYGCASLKAVFLALQAAAGSAAAGPRWLLEQVDRAELNTENKWAVREFCQRYDLVVPAEVATVNWREKIEELYGDKSKYGELNI